MVLFSPLTHLFNGLTIGIQLGSVSLTCTEALSDPGQEHWGYRGEMSRGPSLRSPSLEERAESKQILEAHNDLDSRAGMGKKDSKVRLSLEAAEFN